MRDIETEFLITCKTLYLKGIDPFDFDKQKDNDYQRVITLGRDIIKNDGLQNFLSFFMEGQYNVHRWTAFIGLEYVSHNPEINGRASIVDKCLKVASEEVLMELSEVVDKNREEWLKKMGERLSK